jgi:outer membrane protein assembly factor BamB
MIVPASEAAQRRRSRRKPPRRRHPLLLLAFVFVVAAIIIGALVGPGRKHASRPSNSGYPVVSVRGRVVPVPQGPIPGLLLIADRGNNRLLLVDNRKRIIWRYPPPAGPSYPFHFDDDAFFGSQSHTIISNQEDQNTIQILGFPSGRLLWHYGHPNIRGSAPGYLDSPDDAYQLPNRLVSVADAGNCRVLFIARGGGIARELGRAGNCAHDPPRALGAVNGATPLPGGGTLVSEITGSWIDAFSPRGRLLWDFQAPVSYPSDPQWLGGGRILLADYARPGRVLIVNTRGRVLWRYGPASGAGMLDHPSLAMLIGPGLLAVNDDFRDRVVLISIRTHRIVWQYGRTDHKGSAAGYLNTPDGMDLLPSARALAIPAVRALLQQASRPSPRPPASTSTPLLVRSAPFRLPAPVERAVAVAWNGRILIAGGLNSSGQSAAGVFALNPATGSLRSLGALPLSFHDAAGALIANRLVVFGGGSSTSSNAVQVFDPNTRRGAIVARLPRALSDLAAAQLNGSTYLVGGFDGHVPRPEILSTRDGQHFALAARLPTGLRYPAVAAVAGKILIAGGQTRTGLSAAVYAFDPTSGRVDLLIRLPAAVGHAAAIAEGSILYILGGADAAGQTSNAVTMVNLATRSAHAFTAPTGAVADAASVQLGTTTFLIGGRRSQALATVVEIQRR